jgi:integrase
MNSTEVRIWNPRQRSASAPGGRTRKTRSWEVRWVVGGKPATRTRRTKALADAFVLDLRAAARRGESFDVETGLPESMLQAGSELTWIEFAQRYVDMKWPRAAGKSRDSMTDALATVTPALVTDDVDRPDPLMLRTLLRQYLLPPAARSAERPAEIAAAAEWLAEHSLPVRELSRRRHLRQALDAIALKLDGTLASATTIRRKRSVFNNALQYAVELEDLPANNLGQVGWTMPKVSERVDRRVVVNPQQARELLVAVSYVGTPWRGRHLRTFFACLYFGGLRPAEAVGLRLDDCELPKTGWGRLLPATSRPETNRRWTDSGDTHESRGLKHRPDDYARPVPIPPELVAMLREHIDEFGTASDGRLFRTNRDGVLGSSYTDAWAPRARSAYFRLRCYRHWPMSPTRCVMPPCRSGSTPASQPPRSPNEPGTASRCCCACTRHVSTAVRPRRTGVSTMRWPATSNTTVCGTTWDGQHERPAVWCAGRRTARRSKFMSRIGRHLVRRDAVRPDVRYANPSPDRLAGRALVGAGRDRRGRRGNSTRTIRGCDGGRGRGTGRLVVPADHRRVSVVVVCRGHPAASARASLRSRPGRARGGPVGRGAGRQSRGRGAPCRCRADGAAVRHRRLAIRSRGLECAPAAPDPYDVGRGCVGAARVQPSCVQVRGVQFGVWPANVRPCVRDPPGRT